MMTTFRKFLVSILATLCMASVSAKHTTVVVSLDGFRWDYTQWYHTPFLDFMAEHGVESALIPSFPSKTFPNHYALATGLYPDHHGIVANEFYNPQTGDSFALSVPWQKKNATFYHGEPIWNTAHRQGKRVAVFYWPGSDVRINGRYPDKYLDYDQKPRLSMSARLNGVLQELRRDEATRPDLVMAYLEQPDANGHNFGPQSKKTQAAVTTVDSLLRQLHEGIRLLPHADDINLVVLSDHGMTWVPENHAVNVRRVLKPEWVDKISGSIPCNIYAKNGFVDSVYHVLRHMDHVKVWRKRNIPDYLHYGTNNCVGDVLVCPDPGYVVYDGDIKDGGTHGYDPTLMDMHAVFRAMGPDFKHITLPHFENVNVYELLCALLGIDPAPNDGNIDNVKAMLRLPMNNCLTATAIVMDGGFNILDM